VGRLRRRDPGANGLELSTIRPEGLQVHFELRAGETLLVFDGLRAGAAISGNVIEAGQSYAFDLRKLPVYPRPQNRIEAWKQDLHVVRSRFLEYDRSFSPEARDAFEVAVGRLEASLPDLSDPQIFVALSEAVALSGNAHTRLYVLRNRTELRRLPLRVYWFEDGLFVVRATSEHRDTLGCRVASLAGRDPQWVKDRVARLFAGNPAWIDYKSPYFLTSPEILHGLGIVADMDRVAVRFDCPDREPFERDLTPLPLRRKKTSTEAWVSTLPKADPAPPLYLRQPDRHYWFEYLGQARALYLQYNRSQDSPEGESVSEFAERVEAFIGEHPIGILILDLRFNTGGNNEIAAPFMQRLVALEKNEAIGRLYVITGRATFSAGISHAAYLKQHSGATFVGEPVGDDLDTWSEGGNIELPNSGLTVHFTNGFHSLSNIERPEFEPYLWSDLDLEDLEPDLLVRTSSDDYLSGRDPALEAILSADSTPEDQVL